MTSISLALAMAHTFFISDHEELFRLCAQKVHDTKTIQENINQVKSYLNFMECAFYKNRQKRKYSRMVAASIAACHHKLDLLHSILPQPPDFEVWWFACWGAATGGHVSLVDWLFQNMKKNKSKTHDIRPYTSIQDSVELLLTIACEGGLTSLYRYAKLFQKNKNEPTLSYQIYCALKNQQIDIAKFILRRTTTSETIRSETLTQIYITNDSELISLGKKRYKYGEIHHKKIMFEAACVQGCLKSVCLLLNNDSTFGLYFGLCEAARHGHKQIVTYIITNYGSEFSVNEWIDIWSYATYSKDIELIEILDRLSPSSFPSQQTPNETFSPNYFYHVASHACENADFNMINHFQNRIDNWQNLFSRIIRKWMEITRYRLMKFKVSKYQQQSCDLFAIIEKYHHKMNIHQHRFNDFDQTLIPHLMNRQIDVRDKSCQYLQIVRKWKQLLIKNVLNQHARVYPNVSDQIIIPFIAFG